MDNTLFGWISEINRVLQVHYMHYKQVTKLQAADQLSDYVYTKNVDFY